MHKSFCDILIFGAGIIGASLALRLAQSGVTVIIIDHVYPTPIVKNNIPNTRVSAINCSSMNFFKKINIWKNIPSNFCTAYCRLETWEWPSSKVTFHASSLGMSEMGYVIENNRLQSALWQEFLRSTQITLYCPSKLRSLQYNGIFWECILNNNVIINSRIIIGADGTHSQIRKKLGIGVSGWKYHQYCMLITIKTDKCMRGTIWQKFTPHGPVGFLPLYDSWGSLMWYDVPAHIDKLKRLPRSILEEKIKKNFGKQLGDIKIYNISIMPLFHQRAYYYATSEGALVGDAAHTIHPLAGQGINLGIRDVISLSGLLIDSLIRNDKYINIAEVLMTYHESRKVDVYIMQTGVDLLYTIFHSNLLPLKITRNIAFMMVERIDYIKKQMLKYAMIGHSDRRQ